MTPIISVVPTYQDYRLILQNHNLSLTQLANMAGVSRQLASETVDGLRKNIKVLNVLKDLQNIEQAEDLYGNVEE